MNDVQEKLVELKDRGWTDPAIGNELGYGRVTVFRWRSGDQYPEHPKPIILALDALLERKRVPKKRRYEGTHHLQRRKAEQGNRS